MKISLIIAHTLFLCFLSANEVWGQQGGRDAVSVTGGHAADVGLTEFEPEPIMLADATVKDQYRATSYESGEEGWDISGPIRLRSADPEGTGELAVKSIFDYGTSSDGTDDDFEYELELEYGIAPNHELILEVPIEIGDGAENGNADITFGWHWRLWKEGEWVPAFAMRNYIRHPSGYQSSGVDYELRGLITKSIIPDRLRFHLNPFLKSMNGHNEEDHRDFQWGAIVGMDCRLAENFVLNADYVHETSDAEGERNQHTLEAGLDWDFADHQTLGFVTRTGLDGDSVGENWGFAISYIYTFEGLPSIGR